jgi:hypothetical protein
MSEVVLLPNIDRSQQVEGLLQRLYYYQILTAVNKLKIISEVVLLLPNTDRRPQVEGFQLVDCGQYLVVSQPLT